MGAPRPTAIADMEIREGPEPSYIERHIHGPEGGVTIVPKTHFVLKESARFSAWRYPKDERRPAGSSLAESSPEIHCSRQRPECA